MRIGTALMPSANKVMRWGAGEVGKEVIIAFQRLGVEVIAVPTAEVRLLGQPAALVRPGVALASGMDVAQAWQRAKLVASCVPPVGVNHD